MWFRWHSGTTSDPKLGKIAKIANTSVANVIAVWATLLECASNQDDAGGTRGEITGYDPDSIDYLLTLDDGTTQRIVDVMRERGLLSGDKITNWHKRQVKRERDRTEYSREYARERRGLVDADECDKSTHVNPSQPTSTPKSPREEKSREDKKREDKTREEKIKEIKPLLSANKDADPERDRSDPQAGVGETPDAGGGGVTVSQVIEDWNEHLVPVGFPKVSRSTSNRRKAFNARVSESAERRNREWWLDILRKMYASKFMREAVANNENWLTFDWILNEQNLVKIDEGKYNAHGGRKTTYESAADKDPDEILAEFFGKFDDDDSKIIKLSDIDMTHGGELAHG